MAPAGRRPGGEDTRTAILDAARTEFAASGFHAATIRTIAGRAAVDPALVMHYFNSKEELFGAAIKLPLSPALAAATVLDGGIESAGRAMAALFFSVWELPESRDALLALLRGAFVTGQGAAALREFMGSVLMGQIAPAIDRSDAQLRVQLVAAHLVGVAVLRYVIGFEALVDADTATLVEMVGPQLQAYLTGP